MNSRDDIQPLGESFADREHQHATGQLGMWSFLASEIMFFGALFTGYAVMRFYYPEGFAEGSHHLSTWLGGFNTAILLGSSLFMALADLSAQAGRRKTLNWHLLGVIALGLVFLGIKFYEYYEKYEKGHIPGPGFHMDVAHPEAAELFYMLYFTLTGLHATHMILGIGFISGLVIRSWKTKQQPSPLVVESTGLYWHFVDIVWVFLFPLLYLIG